MDTFIVLVVSGAGIVGLWLLLERTHRRTEHLSRTPFGTDLEGDRDISRTLAEIDAVRSRQLSSRTGAGQPALQPSRQSGESTSGRSHLRAI